MTQEWGPWIEHDGNGCPVAKGTICEVFELSAITWEPHGAKVCVVSGGNGWIWSFQKPSKHSRRPYALARPIIRYRIRKPRGLTILENLIADLPAPVGPKVDA